MQILEQNEKQKKVKTFEIRKNTESKTEPVDR